MNEKYIEIIKKGLDENGCITIEKNRLFEFFEFLTGDEYHFCIHGISDNPEKPNEYSVLPAEEIAKRICETGLLNNYRNSIKRTSYTYGNLAETYSDKNSVEDINNPKPYRTEGEYACVALAIPIVFQTENGDVFSGWINPTIKRNRNINDPECLADIAFSTGVPKEMILGYITGSDDNKDTVKFTFNTHHYIFLNQEQRDEFTKQYIIPQIGKPVTFDRRSNDSENPDYILLDEMIDEQKREYYSTEYQNRIARRRREKEKITEFPMPMFEQEELEGMDIENLRKLGKIPSFGMATKGKYSIKYEMINNPYIEGRSLAQSVAYFQYNPEKTGKNVTVEEFENWVKKMRGLDEMPMDLYQYVYSVCYKEVREAFLNNIEKIRSQDVSDVDY